MKKVNCEQKIFYQTERHFFRNSSLWMASSSVTFPMKFLLKVLFQLRFDWQFSLWVWRHVGIKYVSCVAHMEHEGCRHNPERSVRKLITTSNLQVYELIRWSFKDAWLYLWQQIIINVTAKYKEVAGKSTKLWFTNQDHRFYLYQNTKRLIESIRNSNLLSQTHYIVFKTLRS